MSDKIGGLIKEIEEAYEMEERKEIS